MFNDRPTDRRGASIYQSIKPHQQMSTYIPPPSWRIWRFGIKIRGTIQKNSNEPNEQSKKKPNEPKKNMQVTKSNDPPTLSHSINQPINQPHHLMLIDRPTDRRRASIYQSIKPHQQMRTYIPPPSWRIWRLQSRGGSSKKC